MAITFQKSTIVTGTIGAGKTKFIDQFINEVYIPTELKIKIAKDNIYSTNFIKRLNARNKINSFFFHECEPDTKLIVIDDIFNDEMIYYVASLLTTGVTVNKPNYAPFVIHPSFILECNRSYFPESYFQNLPFCLQSRFEIIDINCLAITKTV